MGAEEEDRLRMELEEVKAALALLRAEEAHTSSAAREGGRTIELAPAPRVVPVASALATLFGGVLPMIGYLFIAFGSIFVWVFVGNSELSTPFEFAGAKARTPGTVVNIQYTGASVNERPMISVHAAFMAPTSLHYMAGGRMDAVGYGSLYDLGVKVGSPVEVEYVIARPATARIIGLSSKPFPGWVGFVLIFPLLGMCFVTPRLLEGARLLTLYRSGAITHGSVVDRWATGTTVNGLAEMAYSFEYNVAKPASADGDHAYEPICARVTHTGINNNAVLNERREPILYDPAHPHVAMLVDGLPGGTYVNAEGNFEAPLSAWLHAIPPLAVLLVNWACAAVASSL